MKKFLRTAVSQRLVLFLLCLVLGTASYAQNCFQGWTKLSPITISNAGTGLTDFQVKLTINTANLVMAGEMKADGSDMRFVDGVNCCTPLCYYIAGPMNSAATVVWVKVPSIVAGTSSIKMLHGNPNAVDGQDAQCTFELFDDFSGNALNTNIWEVRGVPSSQTVANGYLTFAGNGNWEYMRSNATWTSPVVANFLYYSGGVSSGPVTGFTGTDQRYSHRFGNGNALGTTFDPDVSGGNSWSDIAYPNVPGATTNFEEFEFEVGINGSNQMNYTKFCNVTQNNCNTTPKTLTDATGSSFYIGFTSYSSAYVGYVDRIMVRKFANPEPTNAVGSSSVFALGALALADSVSICDGDSANIDGGPNFASYAWSNGATSQMITTTTAGTYTLTVSDVSGCQATDSTVAVVIQAPSIALPADTSLCTPFSLPLDAGSGFASYAWSTGATTNGITVTSGGTYNVTVTNADGCIGTDDIVVSASTIAPVNISANVAIPACEGTDVILDAGAGYASYDWGTASSQTLTVTVAGTYEVSVTDANGCTAQDSIAVSFNPNPAPVVTVTGGLMDAGAGFATYQWYLNGNIVPGATSQTYLAAVSGDYTVVVTNANGCSGESTPSAVVGITAALGQFGFEIYPNPNNGSFVVKAQAIGLENQGSLEIYSIDGRLVYATALNVLNQQIQFEANNVLPTAGVYMLRIKVGEQNFAARVTKQ